MSKKTQVYTDSSGYIAIAVGSALALLASFVLSSEAMELAKNPNATFSCSVSLLLNCATVAKSSAADVFFGIPNSYFGMMALPVLLTIGIAGLAGTKFPRWFMQATGIGGILGLVFAAWMFFQSYFVIQVLCPWCLLTDFSMIIAVFGIFRVLAREKYLGKTATDFSAKNYDLFIALVILVLIVASILFKFGSGLFG